MKIKIVLTIVVAIIILGAVFLIFIYPRYFKKSVSQNLYQISDESLGVSFKISKDFERMGVNELRTKNPSFIYGFQVKDVSDVACYVSQTKRLNPGYVALEVLKNGTFEQVKKNNPTAVLDNWAEIEIGADIKGTKLEISYKESEANFKQIEVVGTTDERTTFAFCSCPLSLCKFYQKDFEEFLDSMRIE